MEMHAFKTSLCLGFIGLLFLSTVSCQDCNIPSEFWCNTKEIATQCGVFDQCTKYEWTPQKDAGPVNVTLYYEAGCPFCREFIVKKLYPAFKTLGSIMNVTIIPYGNAKETYNKTTDRWTFDCQHGPEECAANLIHACTIDIVKNISTYLPFIYCMEANYTTQEPVNMTALKCSKESPSIPVSDILKCSVSPQGNAIEHSNALRTQTHQYVPWVILNGVHTDPIQDSASRSLKKLVCEAYRGATKPKKCKAHDDDDNELLLTEYKVSENEVSADKAASLVDVTLYYETLCPDCKNFFKKMLYPTWLKVGQIMNLTIVPYGNAKESYDKQSGNWTFHCQHGPEECTGNIIQACTIDIVKNISVYLPFIHCMEESNEPVTKAAKKCAVQHPVPLDAITACSVTHQGNTLEHNNAVKTEALRPPHKYVPWVTLGGVHTEDLEKKAEKDLVKLVCDSYKGEKPAACS